MLRKLTALLFLIPALALANVTLLGDRHIGDDDNNAYTPADFITPAQTPNNPLHFSLSSNLTVTGVRINNVFAEYDPGYYVDYFRVEIDGALVGSAVVDDGTTTIPINPLNLSPGVHTIAIYPDCTPDADCEANNIDLNDITFPSVDLISAGTTSHISFNRRYHAGDSNFGNNEYSDAFYPDPPDGEQIALPFSLANDALLETVRVFNLRGVTLSGCRPNEIFIDQTNNPNKIGTITANGNFVSTLTTPLAITAGNHNLIITSGRCSGNDNDDFSWDDIILEFSDATVGGFTITVPATASTCAPIQVNIQALNGSGNPANNYNKTVQISTSSGHGDWAIGDGLGVLDNGTADDGIALYTFATGGSGDGGNVTLELMNTHADDLTVSVVEVGDASTLSTSSVVAFRDNAFVVTATDSLGTEVVAGRPHAMKIEMYTRDGGGNCQVNARYSGNIPLHAWVNRSANDPGGAAPIIGGNALPGSQPAGNNLSLTFTSGVANFTLDTTDVGQYDVQFVDDTSGFAKDASGNPRPIAGGSNVLTVRPFGYSFVAPAFNAGATGAIAGAAGVPFTFTINGVLWETADDGNNDGVPDGHADTNPANDADLSNNGTTPSFAWTTSLQAVLPYTPASGTIGVLGVTTIPDTAFASLVGGSASIPNQTYSEVGGVTVLATGTNYLGSSGVTITSRSPIIGRFIPDHFDLAITHVCLVDDFTYSGQPFGSAMVTARNVTGVKTQNYFGSFAKQLTFATTATSGALTNTSGAASQFASGEATYTGLPTFTFTNKENNPETIALSVSDTDGVSSTTPANADIVAGRIALQDVAGSELLPLVMPVAVQYFDNGWQTHTADQMCTAPTASAFSVTADTAGTSISSLTDTGNGTWDLQLAAPGVGNTGYADITASGIATWLQDDWDDDGAVDDDPQARASFGLYQGNEKQIYIQEAY